MDDKTLMWLLARLFMVNRRGYITSHIEPLQIELAAVLSTAGKCDIAAATDEEITGIFQPKEG